MSGRDHAEECSRCAGVRGGLNNLVCCDDLTDTQVAAGLRQEVERLREESDHFRALHNDAERRRGDTQMALTRLEREIAALRGEQLRAAVELPTHSKDPNRPDRPRCDKCSEPWDLHHYTVLPDQRAKCDRLPCWSCVGTGRQGRPFTVEQPWIVLGAEGDPFPCLCSSCKGKGGPR